MRLLLVNPNTTAAVTAVVLAAAQAAARQGTQLLAVTGQFGPQVIASRAENALAQHSVLDLVATHAPGHDAVVLAVSFDTALWACRELLDIPVIGMTEAGLLMACTAATRFGVLTYGRRTAPLYRELVAAHGLSSRLAGVATLEARAEQTFSEPERVRAEVLAAARQLIERDGAEAVLLAGAALATMAAQLQGELPVPLLDGVACAVALAEARVGLQLPRARVGSVSGTGGRLVSGVSPALVDLLAQTP